jgi:ferredoxin-NADP reductase
VARAAVQRRLSWRLGRVDRRIDETPRVRTIVLEIPGWPGHLAGQHVDVRLTAEDGYQAQRSYSIASPPESGEEVALTVERIDEGEVSPYLVEEVRPGDVFEVRGPIGSHFTWSADEGGPLLLLAGGAGLVPLMAMLRHRAARDSETEVSLLASARSETDALYRRELEEIRPSRGLRIEWTWTRMPPPQWGGFTGRVDALMLARFGPGPESVSRVFCCGPTPYVEHVTGLLVMGGYDPARIHAERFGPTGGSAT